MTDSRTDISRSTAGLFWVAAIGALALDQGIKVAQRLYMNVGDSIPVVEGWLHLTYRQNTGAAFSMLAGNGRLLAATAPIALAAIYVFWRGVRPIGWLPAVATGLIAAGAVGNGFDRLLFGYVTDIIDVRIINFAVFNVADTAITVGGVTLALWLLFFGGMDAIESALSGSDPTLSEEER